MLTVLAVLAILAVMVALAFLVETLVEFVFGIAAAWIVAIWPGMEGRLGAFKTPLVQTIAIGIGIYAAFLLKFDLLYLLATFVEAPGVPITALGMTLTGAAVGHGSSYLHQFMTRFFPPKNNATTLQTFTAVVDTIPPVAAPQEVMGRDAQSSAERS